MTNLTVAEVYAIGLPIIYGMIALEAIFSSITNKSFYRLDDTLCTAGLLIGNILVGSAAKGLSFAVHIFLYHTSLAHVGISFCLNRFSFLYLSQAFTQSKISLGYSYESSLKRGNEFCSISSTSMVCAIVKTSLFCSVAFGWNGSYHCCYCWSYKHALGSGRAYANC
jgi:hypothetical protein